MKKRLFPPIFHDLKPSGQLITMTQTNQQPHNDQVSNVQPIWKFATLYIITFGIYQIPWAHKQWKLIKEQENSNINTWLYALFLGFSLYGLNQKIFFLAKQQGYRPEHSPFQLTLFYWIFASISRLPDPFWLISTFSFVPLIFTLKAVNYYWQQKQPNLSSKNNFTGRELAWIGFGIIFWLLVLIGLFSPK
jgi:hypothetical protein